MKQVHIVDGSGYIFRAYYAVAPLSNKEGFPTNALFGFTRMFVKLVKESGGGPLVVVFDAGRETFRNQIYDQYKANRSECPEDLVPQMPYFRQLAEAMGFPILELAGFEADDVIGTLTKRFERAGVETVIVTGDKDLMQLVNARVTIWDTMKEQRYTPIEVAGKFGVPPQQVAEVLALMGDSSDNVPGLDGVGPKTATLLIEKYGDVETVIRSAAAIRQDGSIRNRNKICDQIESDPSILRLSRRLVEIETNAPVILRTAEGNVQISQLNDEELFRAVGRRAPDRAALDKLVERFEFTSLVRDLQLESSSEPAVRTAAYRTVFADDFDAWCGKLASQPIFSFDCETSSLDFAVAKIAGLSFCWSDDEAWYVPVGHCAPMGQSGEGAEKQVSFERLREKLAGIMADPKILKIGQNLKFDLNVLAHKGLPVNGVHFDTMIAAYLLNPDKRSYSLADLAKEYLGLPSVEFEQVLGDLPDFSHVSIAAAADYSCEDAHYAWLLHSMLAMKIEDHELSRVAHEIDLPLVAVLSRMECRGVLLDSELLAKMSDELGRQIEAEREAIIDLAGVDFNLNSPKQLADVLFNKLGISSKGLKKTKTGISTDSAVLEKLALDHPVPGRILHYRMLHKLKSTYVDTLPAQVSAVTGRLHTKLNQTIAGTGRLSSSEPNLQNIPIQTAEGKRIRSAFVARPGRVLISADYSQIELRLLAAMSGDERMIELFQRGVDIHSETAREILEIDEVSPDQRRIAKTINFGIIYGMGGFRLGRELGIPVAVANRYIESYFARYPKVKQYFAALEEQALSRGFVTTLFGRRRVIAEIDSSGRDHGFLVRAAINAPIQGSAADIIKLAMVRLDARISREKLPVDMLLQIHDELLFETDESNSEAAAGIVREEMEGVVDLALPLKVDIGWGPDWQAAHS